MQNMESDYNMNPENFKSDDLFFGAHLYNLNWTMVFKEVAPLLASERRDFILMVAGTSTINPVIILSWLIITNRIDKEGSDDEFRQEVKAFAEELLTQHMESMDMSLFNADNGASTILKVLGEDYARFQRFLGVYSHVAQEIEIEQGTWNGVDQQYFKKRPQKTKQEEQDPEEQLILPYPVGECWNIGNLNVLKSIHNLFNLLVDVTY